MCVLINNTHIHTCLVKPDKHTTHTHTDTHIHICVVKRVEAKSFLKYRL